ncbi:protein NTM [Salix suchowensis]|nr:protein NTM [Salix suchowensis]
MPNFPSRGIVSKPDQARTAIPSPSPAGGHGFRPTDEELVSYYLRLKMHGGYEQAVGIIAEVNMCDFEPWVLPVFSSLLIPKRDLESFHGFDEGDYDLNSAQLFSNGISKSCPAAMADLQLLARGLDSMDVLNLA